MNTHPMTTTPDSWHEMPVTSFPALVQWRDRCAVVYSDGDCPLERAIRWRPWVNPELPKPDAFEQWWAKQSCQPIDPKWNAWYCWLEAQSHATAAERSRFTEGVEKIIVSAWEGRRESWAKLISDLRALAKGDK